MGIYWLRYHYASAKCSIAGRYAYCANFPIVYYIEIIAGRILADTPPIEMMASLLP